MYNKYLAYFDPPQSGSNQHYKSLIKGVEVFIRNDLNKNNNKQNSMKTTLAAATESSHFGLYKYRNDAFMLKALENKYQTEELVLICYLPIFIRDAVIPKFVTHLAHSADKMADFAMQNEGTKNTLTTDIVNLFLSSDYENYAIQLLQQLSSRVLCPAQLCNKVYEQEKQLLTSWEALKKDIWSFFTSYPIEEKLMRLIFSVVTKTVLLLKMRLLVCITGFLPTSLELKPDIFSTHLENEGGDCHDIRHSILTAIVAGNQTLFKAVPAEQIYGDYYYSLSFQALQLKIEETLHFLPSRFHLGVIMDGNRRWGNQTGLPGHYFGTQKTEEFLQWLMKIKNIEEATLFCLSYDNLIKRSRSEIDDLEVLLRTYIAHLISSANKLSQELEILVIGEIDGLSETTQQALHALEETYNLKEPGNIPRIRRRLNLAIAYDPMKDAERFLKNPSGIGIGTKQLRTDIDYVIRCGDVIRTSGFFPLRTLYSEWLFLPTLWPDMTFNLFLDSLQNLGQRSRRYGS
jgi:undecaprenyl pyrophosphate synthase